MSKVGANVFNIPEFAGWVRDYVKATGSTIVKGEWYREALKNDALDGTLQRAITPEKDMQPGKGPRRTTIGRRAKAFRVLSLDHDDPHHARELGPEKLFLGRGDGNHGSYRPGPIPAHSDPWAKERRSP